ncbi:hypothetical protein [Burkholderia lata]|uniref:hypothetical protein n=1 Tax=Burkholderia lata (strain ATCC 17760 / DSM 23089 / LMG 22485 / NCIMB 9086 / R18194 / 383) TaxID=482957 RepID=UPI0015816949|nr:hypothetical protein [Burkholderia lata]
MNRIEFNAAILDFSHKYSELFVEVENLGWSIERDVEADKIAREPYWDTPFPMHHLAHCFLSSFSGVRGKIGTRHHVRFGCEYAASASSLTETLPYDAERLVLGEHGTARPPAFPIGTLDGWMLFLREDWTTITVSYKWRDMLLSDDPFEIIDEFRTNSSKIWFDKSRHIEINDVNCVPGALIGGAYDA